MAVNKISKNWAIMIFYYEWVCSFYYIVETDDERQTYYTGRRPGMINKASLWQGCLVYLRVSLLEKYYDKSLSFHDALCAAVMMRNKIYRIFSFDHDFRWFGFLVQP